MTNTKNDKLVELGALWKKEAQSGQAFYSGVINLKKIGIDKEVPLVIFKNNFKDAPNKPDLRIYLSQPKGGVAATPAPKPAAVVPKSKPAPTPTPVAVAAPVEENNDDIL